MFLTKKDEMTSFRRLFLSHTESPTYKRYGLQLVHGFHHALGPLAVGMARMVATCQADPTRTNPPGCPKTDARARRLFCGLNYARSEQNEPYCKFEG